MKHLTPTLKYCGAQAESRAISLAGHTEGSTKAVSESTEPKKFRGFGHAAYRIYLDHVCGAKVKESFLVGVQGVERKPGLLRGPQLI